MGSRRRPYIAEFVEGVGIATLRFAGSASDFVDDGPYTRRVAS